MGTLAHQLQGQECRCSSKPWNMSLPGWDRVSAVHSHPQTAPHCWSPFPSGTQGQVRRLLGVRADTGHGETIQGCSKIHPHPS